LKPALRLGGGRNLTIDEVPGEGTQDRLCIDGLGSPPLHFSNQLEVISYPELLQEFVMVVRLSFGLLISISLALTVYFGAAAWRLTGDPGVDSRGYGPPFHLVRPQQP
jgi:hypothetical protein